MNDKLFFSKINNITNSSNIELQGIYNETSMDLLLSESDRFNSIIKNIDESSLFITESSIGDIFKKIGEFFKKIIDGIRMFLAKIFGALAAAFAFVAYKLIPKKPLEEFANNLANNMINVDDLPENIDLNNYNSQSTNESVIIQESASNNPEESFFAACIILDKLLSKHHHCNIDEFWLPGIVDKIENTFAVGVMNAEDKFKQISNCIQDGKDNLNGKPLGEIKDNIRSYVTDNCLAAVFNRRSDSRFNLHTVLNNKNVLKEYADVLESKNIMKYKNEIAKAAFHKKEIIDKQKKFANTYIKSIEITKKTMEDACRKNGTTEYLKLGFSFVNLFVKELNIMLSDCVQSYKILNKTAYKVVRSVNSFAKWLLKKYKYEID